jgi:hypothetical protein
MSRNGPVGETYAAIGTAILDGENLRVMNEVCADGLYSIRKAISLLIFGTCVFMSSCKGSETTWSAEARSPDGKMIATARTIENSGFGTGGGGAAVYLNWTSGSQPPTRYWSLMPGQVRQVIRLYR